MVFSQPQFFRIRRRRRRARRPDPRGDRHLVAHRALGRAARRRARGDRPAARFRQCYQLSSSTPAALVDLAAEGPPAAEPRLACRWQREPLIVVGREANPRECRACILAAAEPLAGIVTTAPSGTERLALDPDRAVLWPYGLELTAVTPTTGQLAPLLDGLFAVFFFFATVLPVPCRFPRRPTPLLGAVPLAGPVEVQLLQARARPRRAGYRPPRRTGRRPRGRARRLSSRRSTTGAAPVGCAADALLAGLAAESRQGRVDNVARAAPAALGPGPGRGSPFLPAVATNSSSTPP